MSLSISLKTTNLNDSNQTVTVSAGSGVTATSSVVNSVNNVSYSFSTTSGTTSTVCTITFTAKTNFYYSQGPLFFIKSEDPSAYTITATDTFDTDNNLTSRAFLSKQAVVDSVNRTLIQLKAIDLDTSSVSYSGETRNLTIIGDENSVFNLKLTRGSDSKTYDFTDNSFTTTATELTKQTINSSGKSVIPITIPTGGNVTYTFELTPSVADGTSLIDDLQDTGNKFKHTFTLSQFAQVGVALTCVSSSGSYADFPSVTINGLYNQSTIEKNSLTYALRLSSNSFKIARQPVASDIEFRTNKTTSSSISSSKGPITLNSVTDLVVGMKVSGSGVSGTPIISEIDTINSTVTFNSNQSISSSVTLTFTASGVDDILNACGVSIEPTNFLLTLRDVETTINDASANGSSSISDADVASANGIMAADTTIISGLNIPKDVHIDNVSSNNLEFSQSLVLENGQAVTFTGSSRNATLTFEVVVNKFGLQDRILNINLDNILTVA
jgi:hypothetical protein